MKRILPFLWLAGLLAALLPENGAAQETPWSIQALTVDGRVDFNFATGKAVATNGVVIRYNDPHRGATEMTARRVTLDQNSGQIIAEGNVVLQRDGHLWKSERLEYNFKTHAIQAADFKTAKSPFYVAGLTLGADRSNSVYTASGVTLTTDDVAEPGYYIRARTLTLIPGKSLVATEATVYLGGVPVFYWPTYSRSLEHHPNNIVLTPGYRSLYGPYLLGTYNWIATTNLEGSVHLDYRQRRGVGGGPDIRYDLGQAGAGEFKFYYARDNESGTNGFGAPIPADRTRLSFIHRATIRTNLTAQIVVREQSDPNLIRDFFEAEFRHNVQPSSFLEVNQLWPNLSLNVLAQPRLNNFFETVERLPDVKLSALPQQLGVTPLYYESENSLGYFRREFANNLSNSYAAWRGDSYHQVTLPQNYLGWLNVTPRVGGRFTHYGEAEGLGAATVEQSRWVFNTGAEISTKASRLWPEAKSKLWDVDGVRHIVEPSINYVFVPSPNKLPSQLPQFDSELPSLRLLPIEYPDYNAIDSVDSQNVFRFGLRNKLQTKREGQLDNLANWALYTDWRLHPRADQSSFADIFSDFDFKPRTWLTFTSENRIDVAGGRWRLADHHVTVEPNNQWSLSLGHRYLRSDPALGTNGFGNNLIRTIVHYRINENWGLRAAHQFEARDGTMEEQAYSLYHDFRSWTGALTLRLRDSRNGREDFTIGFTFSLKAFPRFKLNGDRETPSLLLGS